MFQVGGYSNSARIRDVFPDELPGLLPNREMDFTIDLESNTAPISKEPYRVAPAEMKELKE